VEAGGERSVCRLIYEDSKGGSPCCLAKRAGVQCAPNRVLEILPAQLMEAAAGFDKLRKQRAAGPFFS